MAKRSEGFRAVGPGPEGTCLRGGKGGRLQRIKTGGAFWSEEAEDAFFDALGASCNVTLAAESVGFTTPTVYRQRNKRPEFAARWAQALEQGYERLHLALLEAAVASVEGRAPDPERPIPAMTVAEAMNLLKLHGPEHRGEARRPGRQPRRRSLEEVQDSILRKLDAIDLQRAREEAEAEAQGAGASQAADGK